MATVEPDYASNVCASCGKAMDDHKWAVLSKKAICPKPGEKTAS